ncbi:uncharacterized protein LOC121672998 [Corvus kubaryi]|uniref:uncharacterized protein LOC121672998 n=1 Tax=Corvus kubaryi TaxID=68294 RepID=UPI001C04D3B2|nr:uncharacterized protein LOC121672998 [Corvus kubaryi]
MVPRPGVLWAVAAAALALLVRRAAAVLAGPVVRCEPCDSRALQQCKPLQPDCAERVREPGCGCCLTCALRLGQPCGIYTERCGAGLSCQPRRQEARPLQALLEGRGLCTNATAGGKLRAFLLPGPHAAGKGLRPGWEAKGWLSCSPLSLFAAFLLVFFFCCFCGFFVCLFFVSLSFVLSYKGSSMSGGTWACSRQSSVSGNDPRSLSACCRPVGGGLCWQPRSRAWDHFGRGVLWPKERTIYLFHLIYVYTDFLQPVLLAKEAEFKKKKKGTGGGIACDFCGCMGLLDYRAWMERERE